MDLISINGVTKIYQSGSHLHPRKINAVRGVTLHIEEGECLALVGESGSGKSTLGRMIVGLENPTDGSILFRGKTIDARRIDRSCRQALQMVYQNSFEASNPRFSAKQIVEEPIRYFNLYPRADRDSIIKELLLRVGIPWEEADKKPSEFSGGQLQRICIARALASKPEMLLLDEPLSSLDVSVQAQILNLLKRLKEDLGLTYLLISHDLEVVYNLADRLAVMYSGKIVEEIDDIELFNSLRHPYTSLLLGRDINEGVLNDHADIGTRGSVNEGCGCVYAGRCPLAEQRCMTEEPKSIEFEPGHRLACHKIQKGEIL